MSLPSWTLFFNDGCEISETFVNCGWFYSDDLVPRLFHEMAGQFPEVWDKVIMYGVTYTRDEVMQLVLFEQMRINREMDKRKEPE